MKQVMQIFSADFVEFCCFYKINKIVLSLPYSYNAIYFLSLVFHIDDRNYNKLLLCF